METSVLDYCPPPTTPPPPSTMNHAGLTSFFETKTLYYISIACKEMTLNVFIEVTSEKSHPMNQSSSNKTRARVT